jgi:CheY-like chemotaxis protein
MEHDEKTSVPRSLENETLTERRILCVDDDEDILAVLCEMLTESGFRVLCESDAQRARCMVQNLEVDAAVLDYQMPGCNGLELASAIRACKPSLPIVMFSGAPPPGEPPTTLSSFVPKSSGVLMLIHALQQELKRSVPASGDVPPLTETDNLVGT